MEGYVECCCGSRLVDKDKANVLENIKDDLGPAHAVYFATYEGVKQLMGGNQAGKHHPLAAGTLFCRTSIQKASNCYSYQRSMCHDRERCPYESL